MNKKIEDLTERYKWMFRNGKHLVSATDQSGRFYDVSDEFASLLGYDREALLKLSPADIATEETVELFQSECFPLLKITGVLTDVAVEYKSKSGDSIKLVANTVLSEAAEDGLFFTVSAYRKIDDWAKISHQFKSLYRKTPAMLHTLDSDDHIVEVSDRWLHKLGYTRKEVIGRYIGDFYSDDIKRKLKGGNLTHLGYADEYTNHAREMVCKSGKILEVLVSAARVRSREDKNTRLQVAIKDVTDRNQAQRDLQAAFEENAKLRQELELERDYLRETVNVSMNYGEIVGSSNTLKQMLNRIDAVAHTTASVLIVGESGTGKELVSHAIHSRSARKNKPLVTVNCASIPHELFESEFFGHVKGAFTGATRDRVGRFQLANGGTIFLDEIGEIPLDLQSKLLRVLQQQEFERVGDDKTLKIDVRVIAATNRDLETEVAAGRFREDLYYRLNVFPIEVPPLRERGDDVVQLASHFIEQICKDFGRPPIAMSERDIRTLKSYNWPGNVRELKNLLERAIILSKDNRLNLRIQNQGAVAVERTQLPANSSNDYLTEAEIKVFLRKNLEAALRAAEGKVSGENGAAELLGIKPTTLADRLRAFDINMAAMKRGRPKQQRTNNKHE